MKRLLNVIIIKKSQFYRNINDDKKGDISILFYVKSLIRLQVLLLFFKTDILLHLKLIYRFFFIVKKLWTMNAIMYQNLLFVIKRKKALMNAIIIKDLLFVIRRIKAWVILILRRQVGNQNHFWHKEHTATMDESFTPPNDATTSVSKRSVI